MAKQYCLGTKGGMKKEKHLDVSYKYFSCVRFFLMILMKY